MVIVTKGGFAPSDDMMMMMISLDHILEPLFLNLL